MVTAALAEVEGQGDRKIAAVSFLAASPDPALVAVVAVPRAVAGTADGAAAVAAVEAAAAAAARDANPALEAARGVVADRAPEAARAALQGARAREAALGVQSARAHARVVLLHAGKRKILLESQLRDPSSPAVAMKGLPPTPNRQCRLLHRQSCHQCRRR